MHVIEVVLAPDAQELSEVRCDGAAVKWFSQHADALAFAEHYADALGSAAGVAPFISVCRTDGKWVALSELTTGTAR